MTEPVAYMWKTERGTIIGFTPNDNSHSGGQLGILLYTAEQLHPMKWFVRSKEKYQGFYMFLGNLNELRDPFIFTKQDNFTSFAHQFYTKEEAEKWTNPLTEAVQLPVEDNND